MIPFSPPYIDQKIVEEVVAALTSGWITTGPRTKLFEQKISSYCDVEKTLAVNSWTAGAELVLRWFGIQEGDEVIIPAYTYCATANIVIHCGATPIMIDVNDDFCIDTIALEKAITPKTKAIISVDIAGYPVDYAEIRRIVEKQEIKNSFIPNNEKQKDLGRILLLSDAAHSFGASYKNEKVGSQADFTVFSFHAVKNLTTAEGGAICINMPSPFVNEAIYKELNIWSLHGQTKDALAKAQKGAWEYDVITAGYKCNMTDILASIGLVEIERYQQILDKRKEIFEYYNEKLSEFSWAITPNYKREDKISAYHLYLLRIKGISLAQRNEIIQCIFDNDVSVNVHYKPLPELTYYKELGYDIKDYPMSKQLWETEISLPLYYSLTYEQVETVVNTLIKCYQAIVK